jgi:DNA repair protein RecN (Recombination protein N)
MLCSLHIANLAVIESVELEFAPGFNVLTGETGAGKSVIAEAIDLLIGRRASGDSVRTGRSEAWVEGTFRVGSESLRIRREILRSGRSRALVNGAGVTAAQLRDASAGLVDVHGQHEHQRLLDPQSHLAVLDGFGDTGGHLARVGRAWAELTRLEEALRRATMDARERTARLEWLTFQLDELEQTQPRVGEDEGLAADKQRLLHAERVQRLCRESYDLLVEREGAAGTLLGGVWKRLDELASVDPSFVPLADGRHTVSDFLADLSAALRTTGESLEDAETQLTRVESRLVALERLKRQHGGTLEDVLARWAVLSAEREGLRGVGEPDALVVQLRGAEEAFQRSAAELSTARRAAAQRLASGVEDRLARLAMEAARFEVRLAQGLPRHQWGPYGFDAAEFFLSANIGEELRPLAKVASGGELSRLMLALQLVAGVDGNHNRTVVFDEVDAGIGGAAAHAVAESLRGLSEQCQVICVTHLAAIAARADHHLVVAKSTSSGRTATSAGQLAGDARIDELARMVSGRESGAGARQAARELLAEAAGESRMDGKRRKRRS